MKDFKTIKKMVKQIAFILNKKQKWQMLGMFIVIVIGAAFELLGVTMLLPFVQSILAPEELWQNPIVNYMARLFNIQGDIALITFVGILLVIVYIVKNSYLMFSAYLQASALF